jgi:predicted DNA-binding transcriptional regulator AlpA
MTLLGDADGTRKKISASLPLLRYEDLRAQGVARTWQSLNKWIDERGFPPGRMIGRFRTWTAAEVMAWVESQPTTKLEPRGAAKQAPSNGGA